MSQGTEEKTVSEWIDAFNDRDLDGMLSRVDSEVHFHPLRTYGIQRSYFGHGGVRRWFAEFMRQEHPHRIDLESVTGVEVGRVLAAGRVPVTEGAGVPFSGLYETKNGVIACAHHYFTPAETLFRIGIVGGDYPANGSTANGSTPQV